MILLRHMLISNRDTGRVIRRKQSSSIAIDRDRTKKIRTICVVRPTKVVRLHTLKHVHADRGCQVGGSVMLKRHL